MLKRILCVLSSFMILASSAYAWDSDSFIGMDENTYYEFDWQPSWQPAALGLGISPYVVSEPTTYNVDFSSPSSVTALFYGSEVGYFALIGSGTYLGQQIPGTDYIIPDVNVPYFSFGNISSSVSYSFASAPNTNWYRYSTPTYSLRYSAPSNLSYLSYDFVAFPRGQAIYNIPVPSDTYSVSWSPSLTGATFEAYTNGSPYTMSDSLWEVLIDGKVYDSQLINYDSGKVQYSQVKTFDFSSPVTSLQLRVTSQPCYSDVNLPSSSSLSGSLSVYSRFLIRSTNKLEFSFLGNDQALIGNINSAQDQIDNHNYQESYWTGSMTSNFDALNISQFNWPFGLLSGFSLISGIFNDIWNSMGDYRVVYVFPLMLGVIMLLVGRLSKARFASKSGGGEE